MTPLNAANEARQAARTWSGQLGNLAADLPVSTPEGIISQFNPSSTPPLSAPSNAVLTRLWQRAQRREHAANKLRAQEFLTGQ